jgi:leucyl aminopeptidase
MYKPKTIIMKSKLLSLLFILAFMSSNTFAQYYSKNDSLINIAMSNINADSIEYQLQWLQDMGTRFLLAPNHKQVAEKIKARFESYGMTYVRLDSFQCYTNINYSILHYDTTTWQYNVEAKIIGTNYPDEEIVLMGHHDNVQLDSDPEIYAPGADDNGSGTVAALETARVLMQMGYEPERTIVFLTTAAEELMYFGDAGSRHYAYEAADSGRNIWGVINNDMIAYDNGTNTITLSNVIGSEEITGVSKMIAETYTNLVPDVDNPNPSSGADLQPFIEVGYRGVYLMEKTFNPYYHTELDLVENCDLNYLTEAIKISCGTVIHTDITVGIVDNIDEPFLSVYPNPASNYLYFRSNSDNWERIRLLSINGSLIFDVKYTESIDISSINGGYYILQAVSETGSIITDKVIIK